MTDDEFRQLRQLSDAMPSVDLAVVSPSKREPLPAIEQSPESPQASEEALPVADVSAESLEVATAAEAQPETLDSAAVTTNSAETLDVVSAPATGDDRPFPTDAPVAELDAPLEIPVAPSMDSQPLDTAGPSETLQESGGELETPAPSTFDTGDAEIPSSPPASTDPDLAIDGPPDSARTDLSIPMTGSRQDGRSLLDTPFVKDESRDELTLGGPTQEAQSPLGFGYVPLEPGRSDLWVYDDSQTQPPSADGDVLAVLQTGFDSVRDRMLSELDRQLQEQAVLATMRETDFG